MDLRHKYKASDKLKDLISDNSLLLMVLNRFGISLGFGEKSVKESCDAQNVDVATFLAVANFISNQEKDFDGISLASLIEYLKQAHIFFLDYNLPTIRRRLIEAIDCSGKDDVAVLILRFYDEYVVEVRKHMEYEDKKVFTYVEQMPTFPGGETALMKYIAENLRYPSVSQDQGIQGLVIIKFVVTDTGNVGEIQIVKALDPNCDREALRLVKTLPKFHPGRHQGKPVNVWYQIPIRFMIK